MWKTLKSNPTKFDKITVTAIFICPGNICSYFIFLVDNSISDLNQFRWNICPGKIYPVMEDLLHATTIILKFVWGAFVMSTIVNPPTPISILHPYIYWSDSDKTCKAESILPDNEMSLWHVSAEHLSWLHLSFKENFRMTPIC